MCSPALASSARSVRVHLSLALVRRGHLGEDSALAGYAGELNPLSSWATGPRGVGAHLSDPPGGDLRPGANPGAVHGAD